jgi:hypothetical protein
MPAGRSTCARLSLRGRDVDQHQVHRPAAEPVFGLRRRPGRQLQLLARVAAYPRSTRLGWPPQAGAGLLHRPRYQRLPARLCVFRGGARPAIGGALDMTRDEARRIAVNIAKLRELLTMTP